MKSYNGHRSWNAWNVSLWVGNTKPIYNFAMSYLARARQHSSHNWLNIATRHFMNDYEGQKTPDGAKYNHLSVKLCLEGFVEA